MDRLNIKPWERVALFTLLAVALALRIYKINAPLWFDEIVTVVYYLRDTVSHLVVDYSSMNNHLFYSLQAKLAVELFGEHTWVVRLPAVLFGVGSIWALWRLARTVVGPAEALVAAALLALSYHHVWFSQNARGYTELMFWSLVATLLFVEAWGTRSWRLWGGFGLVLAAAMYTHLTAAFFVAALGLVYGLMLVARWIAPKAGDLPWLAPRDRVAQFAPLAGFVTGGVITLALLAPVVLKMFTAVLAVSDRLDDDKMQEYQNPIWSMIEGFETMGGSSPLMMVAVPGALLLLVVGGVDLLRRKPIVPAVGIMHVLVTVVTLMILGAWVWPRFFFTDIAFVMLLVTHGALVMADFFGRWAKRIGLGFATPVRLFFLAAVVMLAASAVLVVRNYTTPKQDFPGAVELLAKAGASPASVGALGLAAEPYSIYFKTGWPKVTSPADIEALTPSQGRRWVVLIFPTRTGRDFPGVMKVLERDYTVAREFPGTLGDGEVMVYESKPAPTTAPAD